MIIGLLRISGDSLEPRFRDGDFVLVSRIPILLKGLRRGDVVVFRQPGYGILIKIAVAVEGEEIQVAGLRPDSIDSRQFGAVRLKDVIGKVVWGIQKRA